MVTISFASTREEARGLDYLLGRFNFHTRRDGTTLVPETALIAMAREGLPFKVEGSATYEDIVSARRNSASAPSSTTVDPCPPKQTCER